MGQYHKPINLTKRQFIHPHKFGDGLKLLEFGCDSCGTMTALAILLSSSNGRGGGDLRSEGSVIGSWAGDNVVIAGDYSDPKQFVPDDLDLEEYKKKYAEENSGEEPDDDHMKKMNIYDVANYMFEDVSAKVMAAMLDDQFIREDIEKKVKSNRISIKECYNEALAIRKSMASAE